jgi:hypothetical protein
MTAETVERPCGAGGPRELVGYGGSPTSSTLGQPPQQAEH